MENEKQSATLTEETVWLNNPLHQRAVSSPISIRRSRKDPEQCLRTASLKHEGDKIRKRRGRIIWEIIQTEEVFNLLLEEVISLFADRLLHTQTSSRQFKIENEFFSLCKTLRQIHRLSCWLKNELLAMMRNITPGACGEKDCACISKTFPRRSSTNSEKNLRKRSQSKGRVRVRLSARLSTLLAGTKNGSFTKSSRRRKKNKRRKTRNSLSVVCFSCIAVQRIGYIFLRAAPLFHIYKSYAICHAGLCNAIAKLDQNPKFTHWFRRTYKNNFRRVESRGSLQSYLILPIQRIPRYLLLLKELSKAELLSETPPNEASGIQAAAHSIKNAAEEMNKGIKESTNRKQLCLLRDQFSSGYAPHEILVKPRHLPQHRLILCKGIFKVKFQKLKTDSNEPPSSAEELMVHLLSDAILFSHCAGSRKLPSGPLQYFRGFSTVEPFGVEFRKATGALRVSFRWPSVSSDPATPSGVYTVHVLSRDAEELIPLAVALKQMSTAVPRAAGIEVPSPIPTCRCCHNVFGPFRSRVACPTCKRFTCQACASQGPVSAAPGPLSPRAAPTHSPTLFLKCASCAASLHRTPDRVRPEGARVALAVVGVYEMTSLPHVLNSDEGGQAPTGLAGDVLADYQVGELLPDEESPGDLHRGTESWLGSEADPSVNNACDHRGSGGGLRTQIRGFAEAGSNGVELESKMEPPARIPKYKFKGGNAANHMRLSELIPLHQSIREKLHFKVTRKNCESNSTFGPSLHGEAVPEFIMDIESDKQRFTLDVFLHQPNSINKDCHEDVQHDISQKIGSIPLGNIMQLTGYDSPGRKGLSTVHANSLESLVLVSQSLSCFSFQLPSVWKDSTSREIETQYPAGMILCLSVGLTLPPKELTIRSSNEPDFIRRCYIACLNAFDAPPPVHLRSIFEPNYEYIAVEQDNFLVMEQNFLLTLYQIHRACVTLSTELAMSNGKLGKRLATLHSRSWTQSKTKVNPNLRAECSLQGHGNAAIKSSDGAKHSINTFNMKAGKSRLGYPSFVHQAGKEKQKSVKSHKESTRGCSSQRKRENHENHQAAWRDQCNATACQKYAETHASTISFTIEAISQMYNIHQRLFQRLVAGQEYKSALPEFASTLFHVHSTYAVGWLPLAHLIGKCKVVRDTFKRQICPSSAHGHVVSDDTDGNEFSPILSMLELPVSHMCRMRQSLQFTNGNDVCGKIFMDTIQLFDESIKQSEIALTKHENADLLSMEPVKRLASVIPQSLTVSNGTNWFIRYSVMSLLPRAARKDTAAIQVEVGLFSGFIVIAPLNAHHRNQKSSTKRKPNVNLFQKLCSSASLRVVHGKQNHFLHSGACFALDSISVVSVIDTSLGTDTGIQLEIQPSDRTDAECITLLPTSEVATATANHVVGPAPVYPITSRGISDTFRGPTPESRAIVMDLAIRQPGKQTSGSPHYCSCYTDLNNIANSSSKAEFVRLWTTDLLAAIRESKT